MAQTNTEAREKLAAAGRILSAAGQGEWTRGHITHRCPENPELFFMKPKDVGLEEITPEAAITCDMNGEKVEGEGTRHSEVYIHSCLMRVRPDINAVIHAHPLHAVVFSSLGKPLQAIGLPGAAFSEAMASTMGEHNAMLLQNHGVVVAGRSMDEAIYLAMALESACTMQLMAEWAGGAKVLGKVEEVRALKKHMLRESMFKRTFNYLVRKAGR
jgi:L-fuculose-phosphate aldolase